MIQKKENHLILMCSILKLYKIKCTAYPSIYTQYMATFYNLDLFFWFIRLKNAHINETKRLHFIERSFLTLLPNNKAITLYHSIQFTRTHTQSHIVSSVCVFVTNMLEENKFSKEKKRQKNIMELNVV